MFKDIPNSWIIAFLAVALVVLRAFGVDSWTTSAISIIIGYITGKHIEQTRNKSCEDSEEVARPYEIN